MYREDQKSGGCFTRNERKCDERPQKVPIRGGTHQGSGQTEEFGQTGTSDWSVIASNFKQIIPKFQPNPSDQANTTEQMSLVL